MNIRNPHHGFFSAIKTCDIYFKIKSRYTPDVIPANAGTQQTADLYFWFHKTVLTLPIQLRIDRGLDSRLRGNDREKYYFFKFTKNDAFQKLFL